jgi:D-alanyl-D-alanine carboxypeptidase
MIRVDRRLLPAALALAVSVPLTFHAQSKAGGTGAQSLRERLQPILDAFHAASTFPGATAGIAFADGTSLGLAAGVSDRASKTPMKPTDRLLAGSVGKTYVSAVALQLVHEGKFGLDDPIARHLGKEPWFTRIAHADRITVRHLMTHTSGLVRYELNPKFTADLSADPDRTWTPEARLAYLFDSTPPFLPGQGWEYSDTNYIVLGMIIERAGGAPYYTQLRKRILEPFELKDTVPVEGRVVPGLVQGYAGSNNPFGGTDEMIKDGRFAVNPQFEWTGGGVATTAEDLARWAVLLYQGKAFDTSLLDDLLEGVPAKLGPETKYGLGVIIRPTPLGVTYGHSGFMPGYQTDVMYFPQMKAAVAVQINSSAPRTAVRPLRSVVIELAQAVPAG